MKTALICGISGQDGAYLAQLLLSKGYAVCGTSRDAQGSAFGNLKIIGIKDQVRLISMVPEDFRSVFLAIKQSKPDEVYYLAGQSSVGLSFVLCRSPWLRMRRPPKAAAVELESLKRGSAHGTGA